MPRTPSDKTTLNQILPPLRCSEYDCDIVAAKAREAGISKSEFRRRAYRDCKIIVRDRSLEYEAVRDLQGIANNLNQLMRKTHIHDEVDPQKVEQTLSLVKCAIHQIVEGKK